MDWLKLLWLEIETGILDPSVITFCLLALGGLCLFFAFFSIWKESNTLRQVYKSSMLVVPPPPADLTASLWGTLLILAVIAGVAVVLVKGLF